MSRCLRDQTLLLLYEGEGTSADRDHLEVCTDCTTRYQRLGQDLKLIGQVLREPPPLRQAQDRSPQALPYRFHPLRIRWMPVAAALAVTLTSVWGGMWERSPSPPVLPAEAGSEAVFLSLEEMAAALFSTAEVSAELVPAPVSNLAYLQAALEGEWPCGEQEPFSHSGCNNDPVALLFEG